MGRIKKNGRTYFTNDRDHPMGAGRPETWTEEKIDAFADNITEWSKRDDALMIAQWELECDFTYAHVEYFRNKSQKFAEAHEQAKKRIGVRRFNLTASEDLSERIYLKEQWNYCVHTRKREDEREQKKIENQVSLLQQLQLSEDLVNAKDPSSNIPLGEQE